MHGFERGARPPELLEFVRAKTRDEQRDIVTVAWDELDKVTKDALFDALAEQQGYLCAYCGSRIWPDAMRIEHWEAQASAPEKRFEWENLFGVCQGGGNGRASPL